MTTYQTRFGEITDYQARVLSGIDSAYAYQPPAYLMDAAQALFDRGLIEPCPGFQAVTQLTGTGHAAWQQVQDAMYDAEERARDQRSGTP